MGPMMKWIFFVVNLLRLRKFQVEGVEVLLVLVKDSYVWMCIEYYYEL